MSRGPLTFKQRDVTRALKGAVAADESVFIYFMRAGEFVKIGRSKQWKLRMREMQTGSPYTIVPLLVIVADAKTERELHRRFKADHFRGEWFHNSPKLNAFIKDNLFRCVAKSADDDLRGPVYNEWDYV